MAFAISREQLQPCTLYILEPYTFCNVQFFPLLGIAELTQLPAEDDAVPTFGYARERCHLLVTHLLTLLLQNLH